jgi:hypothetical protein
LCREARARAHDPQLGRGQRPWRSAGRDCLRDPRAACGGDARPTTAPFDDRSNAVLAPARSAGATAHAGRRWLAASRDLNLLAMLQRRSPPP